LYVKERKDEDPQKDKGGQWGLESKTAFFGERRREGEERRPNRKKGKGFVVEKEAYFNYY